MLQGRKLISHSKKSLYKPSFPSTPSGLVGAEDVVGEEDEAWAALQPAAEALTVDDDESDEPVSEDGLSDSLEDPDGLEDVSLGDLIISIGLEDPIGLYELAGLDEPVVDELIVVDEPAGLDEPILLDEPAGLDDSVGTDEPAFRDG